jgi:hypothetical protein
MLKDMTRFGARIEGVELPRLGEPITLLLPGQAARMAFVVWARGRTSGLEFGDPLHQQVFDDLIRDYAIGTAMISTGSSAVSSGRGARLPLLRPCKFARQPEQAHFREQALQFASDGLRGAASCSARTG